MWPASLQSASSAKLCLVCRTKAADRLRAIQPINSSAAITKSLAEWESEGRMVQDPAADNLPADVREKGVIGVSFALLKQIAAEKDVPANWTMAQVCTEVVKPQTCYEPPGTRPADLPNRKIHCAYAALIGRATDAEGQPLVGTATRFVTYSWRYSWSIVFSALESFERRQAEAGAKPSYFL